MFEDSVGIQGILECDQFYANKDAMDMGLDKPKSQPRNYKNDIGPECKIPEYIVLFIYF